MYIPLHIYTYLNLYIHTERLFFDFENRNTMCRARPTTHRYGAASSAAGCSDTHRNESYSLTPTAGGH